MLRGKERYFNQMKFGVEKKTNNYNGGAVMTENEKELLKMLKELYEEVNSGNAEDDTNTRWPDVRDLIHRMEVK